MNKNHFFMVHGDEAVHLHSPSGKPFSVSVDDAGGLRVQDETSGKVSNLSEEIAGLKENGGGSGGSGVGVMAVPITINAPDGFDGTGECEGTMGVTWGELSKAIADGTALFAVVKVVLPDGSIHITMQMAEYSLMYMDGAPCIASFKAIEHWAESSNDGTLVHHNFHGCDLMPHHPSDPQSPPFALYFCESKD